MTKKSLALILGGSALAASVLVAPRASATTWWTRTPASTCSPDLGNYNQVGYDSSAGYMYIEGAASGVILTGAVCGFNEIDISENSVTTSMLDTNVSQITVDLYNPTGSQIAANSVSAEACVFSGWSTTCGSSSSNSAIAAGGHQSLNLTDTAWTGDTGGYAYVYLSEANNTTSYVAGLYIQD